MQAMNQTHRIATALIPLLLAVLAAAQSVPPRRPADNALLPQSFAGWKQTTIQRSADATQADPANAALLKEFGFIEEERASYQRSGRQLKLTAVRFADSGGALGAFGFYREPGAIA